MKTSNIIIGSIFAVMLLGNILVSSYALSRVRIIETTTSNIEANLFGTDDKGIRGFTYLLGEALQKLNTPVTK